MTRVRWTLPARDDLRRIDDWLTQRASAALAVRSLQAIRSRGEGLKNFPRLGRPYQDDARVLRVLGTGYLLLYRLRGEDIEILRVHHEREDWQVVV